MQIAKNSTVYIRFTATPPRKFTLYDDRGQAYYWRYMDGRTPRIKFNIVHGGNYTGSDPFEVVKIVSIELPEDLPTLPVPTRDRVKDVSIVDNPTLSGTPARIFTQGEKAGTVERGPNFYRFPKPLRLFFLLHEIGHLYYGVNDEDMRIANGLSKEEGGKYIFEKKMQGEKNCDAYALYHFLKMGFNRSTAFYALSHVLRMTNGNKDRMNSLINHIQTTQDGKLRKIA